MRRQHPCNRAGLIGVARDFVQVGPHSASESRQGDRGLSLKQRPTEFPLQGADGRGQRGLGDAASPGGGGEIELLAQGEKVTDLLHLHW